MSSEELSTSREVLVGEVDQHVVLAASLDTVWAAFARLEIRDRWFRMPGPRESRTHELDFRVGGSEVATSVFPNIDREERLEHRGRFLDIVEKQRITSVSEFRLDGVLKLVALSTWQLTEVPEGVRAHYREQYQFLEVIDDGTAERGERRGGTRFMLTGLKLAVES